MALFVLAVGLLGGGFLSSSQVPTSLRASDCLLASHSVFKNSYPLDPVLFTVVASIEAVIKGVLKKWYRDKGGMLLRLTEEGLSRL